MVDLKDNGDIEKDGKVVGYLGWHENMIVDVHVEKKHRNKGIATEAVSQLIDRVKSQYDILKVNTVLSVEMEKVLQKNNFDNKVVEKDIIDISEIPQVDKVPTDEKVVWYRYL